MLDISRRQHAAVSTAPPVEFLRIELAPLITGDVLVSLTATTVDDEEAQLLDQEILRERISTLDEMLALIRTHVRIGEAVSPRQN